MKIINNAKVKKYVMTQKEIYNLNGVSNKYYLKLSEEIKHLIDKSIKRCNDNKRSTLMDRDL